MGCEMRNAVVVGLVSGILAVCAGWARAQTINLSTGLNGSGNVITTSGVSDANWTVDQSGGGTAAAQTVFPGSPDWGPPGGGETGWVANDNNSDWIARDASTPYQSQGIATYSFYRTFDLTGYDLSTVIISGSWAADSGGDALTINGHQIDALSSLPDGDGSPPNWEEFHPFSVANPSFLNQGLNTLAITLIGTDGSIDGARLSGTVNTVPEPTSFVMWGAGAIGLLAYAWRKRRVR